MPVSYGGFGNVSLVDLAGFDERFEVPALKRRRRDRRKAWGEVRRPPDGAPGINQRSGKALKARQNSRSRGVPPPSEF